MKKRSCTHDPELHPAQHQEGDAGPGDGGGRARRPAPEPAHAGLHPARPAVPARQRGDAGAGEAADESGRGDRADQGTHPPALPARGPGPGQSGGRHPGAGRLLPHRLRGGQGPGRRLHLDRGAVHRALRPQGRAHRGPVARGRNHPRAGAQCPAGAARRAHGGQRGCRDRARCPGPLHPRPHRARPARGAGPGGWARGGDRSGHPNPLAPAQEQPRPDRRGRGRQDGDRRGPGPAHRRCRGARYPDQPAPACARHGRGRRRGEDARRVRGAAEIRARRRDRGQGAGDPVHRRAAHRGRRRGRRRRARRPEPAQDCARPGDAAGHWGRYPGRVPPLRRDRQGAGASFPPDPGARALGRGDHPHPDRHRPALRAPPSGPLRSWSASASACCERRPRPSTPRRSSRRRGCRWRS